MKMSAAYLAETAQAFRDAGFDVSFVQDQDEENGVVHFDRDRHDIRRGEHEHIVLETLTYPNGDEAWWITIEAWHGLTAHSYPLDSWKYRPDRVEFKFAPHPESGTAPAFTVTWG